ncbi:hypothetical protein [Roseobacter weihaiensis]|uniref:hypothetical protein n=1 Tax=Roseobacter weihaiensis TaxID=2763262 RepID=UPI001D0A0A6F|nr:hypothetical protein [Roseobacter sp. H9]
MLTESLPDLGEIFRACAHTDGLEAPGNSISAAGTLFLMAHAVFLRCPEAEQLAPVTLSGALDFLGFQRGTVPPRLLRDQGRTIADRQPPRMSHVKDGAFGYGYVLELQNSEGTTRDGRKYRSDGTD